ncbi:putative portal protein [Hydrogenobacter thermophilus TK-6]|uniref:Putative portal protein n=1 Tax=Hydrogenobacter thermophilus (strain DSM 6534 / IAM 12695 / TK-6) TaxID=608538 RepID=D3DGQ4_HYDTT|nr:poly(3-hydroxybutyrate) depolymerase [Hydrogenobacter thermophilus]BAI69006.1 putative portal protein [Hydrogenobacter thermophilus TK-6]
MKIKDEEKILSYVLADIQNAENFYQQVIEPKLIERYQLYNADPEYYAQKFPKLFQRSKITLTDIADTIEWAMPSLMRIFFGGEDVVSIVGRQAEDVKKADILQELINFQIQNQNQGFLIFYKWFKDALIGGLGVVKCYWEREYETQKKEIVLGWDELQLAQHDPTAVVESAQDLGNGIYRVALKISRLSKNQPCLENVPATEFIFHPSTLSVKDSPFVAHRKVVTVDYLKRKEKEGIYKNVDKVIESASSDDLRYTQMADYYLKPYKKYAVSESDQDLARRKVLLYECYTKYDINNDGLLEDVIITVGNNTILRIQENIYGRPPFFVLAPILEPYQLWGKSFADVLKDIQDLKTALVNQIIVNVGMNNDYKIAINDTLVNVQDIVNDKPVIRMKAGADIRQAIMPLPTQPLAPWSFNFLEYIEGTKENRTGITRYNQGLDGRSLNKTASGISMIMQAANQRLELIARIFAETGIKDLFSFLVYLNQQFIDQKTVIRLTNKSLPIAPDDLSGEFDVVISAGIGVGTKQTNMANLQLLLQLYPKLLQLGIATPKNVYNLVKKLIEEMGYKNVDDFLQDPEQAQMKMMMGGLNGGITGEIGIPQGGIPQGVNSSAGEGLPQ